jgi:hypothetical protein
MKKGKKGRKVQREEKKYFFRKVHPLSEFMNVLA